MSEAQKTTATPSGPGSLVELREEPYYLELADEIALFEAAYHARLPVLLKGPTGCGKTRFVEHMAWRLYRDQRDSELEVPLMTIACHEDLTATDMVGRFLLQGDETVWRDGPLTQSVRNGSICYLDEIVEARKDTTVLIHALTDHRRLLPIDKTGELLAAHPDFLLVISYNPGYQSVLKDLKQSTRQRFVALEFDYPSAALESKILVSETGVDQATAEQLVKFAHMTRNLKGSGLEEGASTRLLVHAAKLIASGVNQVVACRSCIAEALTDDAEMLTAVHELSASVF